LSATKINILTATFGSSILITFEHLFSKQTMATMVILKAHHVVKVMVFGMTSKHSESRYVREGQHSFDPF